MSGCAIVESSFALDSLIAVNSAPNELWLLIISLARRLLGIGGASNDVRRDENDGLGSRRCLSAQMEQVANAWEIAQERNRSFRRYTHLVDFPGQDDGQHLPPVFRNTGSFTNEPYFIKYTCNLL
jgi:hypothetical protein